ncbi:hypothetical protein [Cupriavidus pauculus]|uniref:hypothetical protein n=1 Tax=Cupriavidus pauculus TaxID=82633 RepID=UPI001D0CA14E|nr:hypothetical protein [Cupriavidus pauculus]
MAFSRDEFMAALVGEITSKPVAALMYQAGDPLLLAQLGAQATMLAMVSSQIDIESLEAFNKVRDTTVLADATMKGILPFGRCPRVVLACKNEGMTTIAVAVGRRFLDQNGKVWVAESAANIGPGATATISVKQQTTRVVTHAVTNSVPFYQVEVPANTDTDMLISGLSVSIGGTIYPYTPEFANLGPNEPGFALETDEYRRLYAKFGWENTFGVQPPNGAVITLTVEETYGENILSAGAVFTFESITTQADQFATMKLQSVTFAGANEVDMETLRDWAQYPSTYDESAVYLGNFDFLIRRNLPNLRFLSVWNEQVEESVRGPNVRNINTLFVSVLMDNVEMSWLHAEIRRIVRAADDSYRVKFVPAVETAIPLAVSAEVSVVHDVGDVEAKIRAAIAPLYSKDSQAAKRGMMQVNKKRTAEKLKEKVAALQDDGADFEVRVGPLGTQLPEQYRYVSEASLTVTVTQATYNDGLWSH